MKGLQLFAMLILLLITHLAFAQASEKTDSFKSTFPDTSKMAKADSLKALPSDSLKAVQQAPVVVPASQPAVSPAVTPEAASVETQKAVEEKTGDGKDKKGKKNEIIFYGGVNFTHLGTSSGNYESEAHLGYQLGGYYKQGRLLYWQAGARFASSMIGYKPADSADFGSISIKDIDLPLTVGINFTSFMNRVLSVRLFVSAVPAFNLGVGDNDYGITKDKINSFIMYGQGGLGINVAFLVLEAGYNYGFNEVLISNTDSKPGQVFINLGFRF